MSDLLLTPATEADFPEVIDLANRAYRGTGPIASWNTEDGILEGQRLNASLLRDDLARPGAVLLLWRDETDRTLQGNVLLEPAADRVWHMGLLAVQPERQNAQLGRRLLYAAEEYAKAHGAVRIRISVLMVRATLIAWYERRGYTPAGETIPFPYGDDRFGTPLRDDLYFLVFTKAL